MAGIKDWLHWKLINNLYGNTYADGHENNDQNIEKEHKGADDNAGDPKAFAILIQPGTLWNADAG